MEGRFSLIALKSTCNRTHFHPNVSFLCLNSVEKINKCDLFASEIDIILNKKRESESRYRLKSAICSDALEIRSATVTMELLLLDLCTASERC